MCDSYAVTISSTTRDLRSRRIIASTTSLLAASRLSWRWIASMAISIVLVAAALAYLRLPAASRATVYAEDGPLFLVQHQRLGVWGSVFEPYAGYLQFVPRLITNLAIAIAPLERYATTVNILVCLATGVVASLVFLCSRDVVSSLAARLVLASITVLAPLLPAEVLGDMANFHWLVLWLTPWILMYRPTRWWQSGVLAAIVLASALTEIQVVLFLPLVVLSVRRPRSWPISAALIVGVVWQLLASLGSTRPHGSAHPGVLDVLKGYGQQVLVGSWLPAPAGLTSAYVHLGWWSALLGGLPFLAVAVVITFRIRGWRLLAPVVAAVGATATWVAAIIVNRQPWFLWNSMTANQLAHPGLLRYAVVPSMFLIALVVLLADHLLSEPRLAWGAVGACLLVAVMAVQLVWFQIPAVHGQTGPNWTIGVIHAEHACEQGRTVAVIPSSPTGWNVILPCSWVGEH